MSLVDYREIFEQPVSNLPYYICFQKVLEMLARRTSYLIPREKVEFTFDRNLQTQYNATVLYDYMVKLPEWKDRELVADRIAFSNRKNPRIQAADLWVREVMKYADEMLRANQPIMRPFLHELSRTKRFAFNVYATSYFRTMKQSITEQHLSGHTMNEYYGRLKRYNMQDTMEHRIRYHMYLDLIETQKKDKKGSQTFNDFDRARKQVLSVPRSQVKQLEEKKSTKKAVITFPHKPRCSRTPC